MRPESRYSLFFTLLLLGIIWSGVLCSALAKPPLSLAKGDMVRLTRGETLMFQGKNFLGASKGQEFEVLQHDFRLNAVYVGFVKEDGVLIALTVPADALEAAPPDSWIDLLRGVEAFRDLRIEDSKRLLARAAQGEQQRALASSLSARISGAVAATGQAKAAGAARPGASRAALANTMQNLRDTADQLAKSGMVSLALALDEGADRLAAAAGGTGLPPTKLAREDVTKRVAVSTRAAARARQAFGLKRMMEARALIDEGLQAEAARPDLKAMQAKVQRGIEDAEDSYKSADSMRRFEKGAIHALTALERGLKYCSDHPKLIAMKKEMQGAWEDLTAPPVTAKLASSGGGSMKALEEGRHLYTTRCTECHDLELLDSRSMGSWQTVVAGMARRANVTSQEQSRILAYIGAAQTAAGGE